MGELRTSNSNNRMKIYTVSFTLACNLASKINNNNFYRCCQLFIQSRSELIKPRESHVFAKRERYDYFICLWLNIDCGYSIATITNIKSNLTVRLQFPSIKNPK